MASIKEIIALCKESRLQEAYDLAKKDIEAVMQADIMHQLPWAQRELGWTLYYMIKQDCENANFQALLNHLDELKSLDQLSTSSDDIIFGNVLFKIAEFIRRHIPIGNNINKNDSYQKLDELYLRLRDYNFIPSKGYSFLLHTVIKHEGWINMADFIDWWNLDNLTIEDYAPFTTQDGKNIMSLAERAFIAKSKALLQRHNKNRTEEFIPQLEDLIESHPEMTYPGYFKGKLLLSLGSTQENALRAVMPFVRKKVTEFWVWQLLSEVFVNNFEKQMACLLRAASCKTQESFLGKVRIKLAELYITQSLLGKAKYHIDQVIQCYLKKGWKLPFEIFVWTQQPWMKTTVSDAQPDVDFMSITDDILCDGSEEAIAVVTYFDPKSRKTTLLYGKEKRLTCRLPFKAGTGVVLKMNYITEHNGSQRVLRAFPVDFPGNLDFAKVVNGSITKHLEWTFAFLNYEQGKAFVAPTAVEKYHVVDGEKITALVVYDYDRKKNQWNWTCISVKR